MPELDAPDMVIASRDVPHDGSEALHDEERRVVNLGGTLYVNVTEFAAITHGVDDKTGCIVHTFPSGMFVEFQSTNSE